MLQAYTTFFKEMSINKLFYHSFRIYFNINTGMYKIIIISVKKNMIYNSIKIRSYQNDE